MPRKQITFRVTDEELAFLERNAERAGLKIPTYCKNTSLAIRVRPQVIDKEMGKAILPLISHIGSNINQLAKKANEGGIVATVELTEIKEEFQALWEFVLLGKKPQRKKRGRPACIDKESILVMKDEGKSLGAIAKTAGCSRAYVQKVLKNREKDKEEPTPAELFDPTATEREATKKKEPLRKGQSWRKLGKWRGWQ